MEAQARREYAKEMRSRYLKADRPERGRLLDEFTLVTGYHRKYAIALLIREPASWELRSALCEEVLRHGLEPR